MTPDESDNFGIIRDEDDDNSGLNGTVGIAFVALYFLLTNGLTFDMPVNGETTLLHLGDQLNGVECEILVWAAAVTGDRLGAVEKVNSSAALSALFSTRIPVIGVSSAADAVVFASDDVPSSSLDRKSVV